MTAQLAREDNSTVLNGVDVPAFVQTVDSIKAEPALARFRFAARNRWHHGDRTSTTIEEFAGAGQTQRVHAEPFVAWSGEHPVLLGGDGAPNPCEWLLHALVGCITTTLVYHAAARGIAIAAVDSAIEGDVDLRGFLGISERVPKGFGAIRVRMLVKSAASPAALKALVKFSPVLDVVSRAVPVQITVVTY
jgi:uncharacterized OsmC-like protein